MWVCDAAELAGLVPEKAEEESVSDTESDGWDPEDWEYWENSEEWEYFRKKSSEESDGRKGAESDDWEREEEYSSDWESEYYAAVGGLTRTGGGVSEWTSIRTMKLHMVRGSFSTGIALTADGQDGSIAACSTPLRP